jgi:hypothetical protein
MTHNNSTTRPTALTLTSSFLAALMPIECDALPAPPAPPVRSTEADDSGDPGVYVGPPVGDCVGFIVGGEVLAKLRWM